MEPSDNTMPLLAAAGVVVFPLVLALVVVSVVVTSLISFAVGSTAEVAVTPVVAAAATVAPDASAADATPEPAVEPAEAADGAASAEAFAGADSAAADDPNAVNRLAIINNDGQLLTLAPDGSDARQLTSASGVFQFPAWSPDGGTIAVIGGDDESSGVYVIDDAAESELIPLYDVPRLAPIYLYWSPDGAYVSFIANSFVDGLALHLAPSDGSADSRVLATGQPFYWAWDNSSDSILVHHGGAATGAELGFIDLEGDAIGDMLAPPGYFQSPDISPSGQHVVYSRQGIADRREMVVAERNGPTLLTQQHAGSAAMSWSPAAETLAYTTALRDTVSAYGPLQLYDVAADAVTTVSTELVIGFFWSPDGRKLAFLTPQFPSEGNEVRRPAPDGTLIRTQNRVETQDPDVIRLNLWVYELDNARTRYLTTFIATPLFLTQFLPFFDQYARSHQIWSPDSTQLVLPVNLGNISHINLYGLDGSVTTVQDGLIGFWSRQ